MKIQASIAILFLAACGTASDSTDSSEAPQTTTTFASDEKAFSSALATLLTFEFDGQFVSPSAPWSPNQAIQDYLLYTIGHLNTDRAVGRLDKVVITNAKNTTQADGTTLTTFHASLPVAWGSKTSLPTSYSFILPKRGDWQGYDDFTTKYAHTCVDFGAHDVTSGSMWYYYRPRQSGCTLAAEDIVTVTAAVSVASENTTGKYPELHEVWKDNTLSMIAIFGKYEDGATSTADAGIAAFTNFNAQMKKELGNQVQEVKTSANDITLSLALAGGRSITVTSLLVNSVTNAGPDFAPRYNALSANADVIAYHGHAGLGQNVRALVRMGTFVASKYQIVFMNGCDTFAYVDGSLAQKKQQLNPEDPKAGTKYLDMLTNAMPAYFQSMPSAMIALVKGLRAYDKPTTYEQMFRSVDSQQIVVATGEEDNVYFPGYEEGGGQEPEQFKGFSSNGTLARGADYRWDSPLLPVGTYVFSITGTGDADLYVRSGSQPTLQDWDCRPYAGTSEESCTVNVTAPTTVSVLVNGYAASSAFTFTAR